MIFKYIIPRSPSKSEFFWFFRISREIRVSATEIPEEPFFVLPDDLLNSEIGVIRMEKTGLVQI